MTRPAFKLRPPVIREHPQQRAICHLLTIEIAPPGRISRAGVCWWAIDPADYGGAVPGTRIGRGIIAGIPDTFILYRGLAHLVEIKTDDGVLSDPQRSVAAAVLAGGGRVGVARDPAEVLACLDTWQIPRARRVREAA
jgi:hypothetical protein